MTGSLVLDLAISLAGIALMVGVSWSLGAWRTLPLDDARARDRIAFDEPDFNVSRLLIGADGKAAAALSNDGEALIVFVLGDSLATRRFKPGAFEISQDGRAIIARTGDLTMPRVELLAGDEAEAADWASALRG